MAVATGASFKLYSKEETTEGTAPSGNYDQMPCMTFEATSEQGLTQDQILSAGATRDASAPYLDSVQMVRGGARVPVDTVHFGKWLKLLMGAPATTGSSPNYTHLFTSGSNALPTRTFEKAFPTIGKFYKVLGTRANTMTISTDPSGPGDATFELMGLSEATPTGTTGAGTPVTTAFRRFMKPSGQILRNGSALAGITGGSINFSNNMEAAVALRADNRVEAIDVNQATGGGSLTLRFSGAEGIDTDAVSQTYSTVEYDLTIDANTSLAFLYPRAFFRPIGPAIRGPTAITRDYTFIAANIGDGQPLMTVTLKCGVASY